jgi:hypothetical protein
MIRRFKKGYYYKYIGKEIPDEMLEELKEYEWTIYEDKWFKCIKTKDNCVMFENINWYYNFLNYNDFQESKYSPKEKIRKILEEI